jgi:hypothetical protein
MQQGSSGLATGSMISMNVEMRSMSNINRIDDTKYVTSQYRDASNLNTRIGLHQRFSVNPYGWLPWVFDQLELPSQARILELGCGTGQLWLDNIDRIPAGWEITLTDHQGLGHFYLAPPLESRINIHHRKHGEHEKI